MLIEDTDDLSHVFNNTGVEIAQNFLESKDDVSFRVEFKIPKQISCNVTDHQANCSPLIGGVALTTDDATHLEGTLGYKATDSNGNVGFITADHIVNSDGNTVIHPLEGSSIGTVIEYSGAAPLIDGDYAFVQTTASINDDIYRTSSTTYDVTGYSTTPIENLEGTFLYAVGATSGRVSGSVIGYGGITGYVSTSIPVSGGDSGGPVFSANTAARNTYQATVFGHLVQDHSGAWYIPVTKINNLYGITPVS